MHAESTGKWVTHAGKHILIPDTKKSTAKSTADSKSTVSSSAGKKLSLSKKDEVKNFKGPKTSKRGK